MLPGASPYGALDWIELSALELKTRGCDPHQRLHYTGMERGILSTWIPSVGYWSVLGMREIACQRGKGLVRVKPDAARQFKARYGLMTGDEFVLRHGTKPYRLAELAYAAHLLAQQEFFAQNGCYATLGVACRTAYLDSRFAPDPTRRVGILPVEFVLWTRLFDAMLQEHQLTWPEWSKLTPEEKAWIWEGDDDDPHEARPTWSLRLVAYAPAPRQLHGFEAPV